jgi:uncharacterized protein (TIGR00255 family)
MMSMTGYGSASLETDTLSAAVWVRSLNHRYLDLSVHAPRRLAFLEPAIKDLVAARLQRGKVELTLRVSARQTQPDAVRLSQGLAAGVVAALRALQAEHGLAGDIGIAEVARVPGVLEVVDEPGEGDDALRGAALELVAAALAGLDQMRMAEGQRLRAELERLLGELSAATQRARVLAESGRGLRVQALVERARGLVAELGIDEPRLHAELARLVDRSDVSEELQRLESHSAQALDLLAAAQPVGKRLDFLAQELMREANTLGSKAVSAALIQEVVVLKGAIERWREQVQNVE